MRRAVGGPRQTDITARLLGILFAVRFLLFLGGQFHHSKKFFSQALIFHNGITVFLPGDINCVAAEGNSCGQTAVLNLFHR